MTSAGETPNSSSLPVRPKARLRADVERVLDLTVPSHARVYDMLAGGKNHFEVDRAVYDKISAFAPELPSIIKEQRNWLVRVVRYLADRTGIDQFLDCGSGLPTTLNTHEVAQQINSESHVVYVDNDPSVIAHGQALLEDNEYTRYIGADLRRPAELLAHEGVTRHLDLARPLALLQVGTLHLIADDDRPQQLMAEYIDALAPGSYVAITHLCRPAEDDPFFETAGKVEQTLRAAVVKTLTFRTKETITSLFGDLEFVDPGVVLLSDWWPDGPRADQPPAENQLVMGGLARKR